MPSAQARTPSTQGHAPAWLCIAWMAGAGVAAAAPLPASDAAAFNAAPVVAMLDETGAPRWSSMPELVSWRTPVAPPAATVRPGPSVVDRLGWPAAAPEPGLYALVGAVLLGLALRARRRRS